MINELALLHSEYSNLRPSPHTPMSYQPKEHRKLSAKDPNVMWRSDRYCRVCEEGPDKEGTYKGHA